MWVPAVIIWPWAINSRIFIRCELQTGLIRIGTLGSVARRENTDDSDIDIVVELEKPSLSVMYELRESLKLLFGCEMDLVRFRESLRPMLKDSIKNDVVYV